MGTCWIVPHQIIIQAKGENKVRNPGLKEPNRQAKQLLAQLKEYELEFIKRDKNGRADELANHAMDMQQSGTNWNVV